MQCLVRCYEGAWGSALEVSLYHDPVGLIQGREFPIKRGVKQSNVLSPLLFNAGLDYTMRKWKLRVQHCGLHCADDELLTNVRYADDLMLYARSSRFGNYGHNTTLERTNVPRAQS